MTRALWVLMFWAAATAAAWSQAPQPAADLDRRMAQIEAALDALEGRMERIRATTDARERSKLLAEHARALRQTGADVRELGRAFGPQMRAMMGGSRETPSAERMMLEHDLLARRIVLMERMMEQVMQQTMGHLEEQAPRK